MARHPSFKVKNTLKGWCLNVPQTLSDTKQRQRLYFPSRELANAAAMRLRTDYRKHGEGASTLPPRVAGDAAAAWEMLAPRGKSLMDAARFLIAAMDREEMSRPIEDAIKDFRKAREGLGDKQEGNYRRMSEALVEYFPGRSMASITHGEIIDFLEDRTDAPASYNQWIRLVSTFWRWCAKQPREWCRAELVNGFERRETVSGAIDVLNYPQVKTLMETVERLHPSCVIPFAIALFTGMRWKEIARLEPKDIQDHGITVPAISSKTKKRRFIHMTDEMAAWLEAYPVGGTVIPTNWHRKQREIRRASGWGVWSEVFDPPEAPDDLPKWPHNALRHTAASVAVALAKPIEVLIFEHGHSGGLTTLRRHYVGKMPKKDAELILALRPNPVG